MIDFLQHLHSLKLKERKKNMTEIGNKKGRLADGQTK